MSHRIANELGHHEYNDTDKAHKHKQRSQRSYAKLADIHPQRSGAVHQGEGLFEHSNTTSRDVHLFHVGRDDVHKILKYVRSRLRVSLYVNLFGYDDDELNDIRMQKAWDPNVTRLITLDKRQSGSQTEKQLLATDQQKNLSALMPLRHRSVGNAPDFANERFCGGRQGSSPRGRRTGRFQVRGSL